MSSLMNLSSEMLEQILVKFEDVEDVVSLGSTCVRLKGIISSLRIWKIILVKTELVQHGQVMEDRMRTITSFLSSLPDSEAIFSLLCETIYERYPGIVSNRVTIDSVIDRVTVLFPSDPQHHSMSVLGLQLLVLADRQTASQTVLRVELNGGRPNQVLALASLQKKIGELRMVHYICGTEEEGMVLCSVVERSSVWMMDNLWLWGEVGE